MLETVICDLSLRGEYNKVNVHFVGDNEERRLPLPGHGCERRPDPEQVHLGQDLFGIVSMRNEVSC